MSSYSSLGLPSLVTHPTSRAMRHPWANTVLLVLLALQWGTGVLGLASGGPPQRWVGWLHGVGAWTLLVVLMWKGQIILGVLRRRRRWTPARATFVAMTGLLAVVLATGLWWSRVGPVTVRGFSLMVLHGGLAAVLGLPLLWHLAARRWIFRVPRATERRNGLRLAGIGGVGTVLWGVANAGAQAGGLRSATRRFTGSYEQGSGTARFPATSWLFDAPTPLEQGAWRLEVVGVVSRPQTWTHATLLRLPRVAATETLDCTGGWYTTQEWEGVRLGDLLAAAGVLPEACSVTIEGVTGYARRFPLPVAEACLLATHVAGEPLVHGHGSPVRLVVGGRRGYDWVKWVVRVRVNTTPAWRQPPFPLQ